MKDFFFLIIGVSVIAGSFYLVLQKLAPDKYQAKHLEVGPPSVLKVGDSLVQIEIADTDEERSQGLSGRKTLETGHGMLFIFPEPGLYGFWMKDMNFAIDIVWFDESWQVIGIERAVAPETFPQVFSPPRAVKYVLELPAEYSAAAGIDTGSIVFFEDRN